MRSTRGRPGACGQWAAYQLQAYRRLRSRYQLQAYALAVPCYQLQATYSPAGAPARGPAV